MFPTEPSDQSFDSVIRAKPVNAALGTSIHAIDPDLAALGLADPSSGAEELGRLEHYRILRLLGKGAMGMVFLAEDLNLQRKVALKVMHRSLIPDLSCRMRFLREARALASMTHENIVTVFDVGVAQLGGSEDLPFLAMQYLDGESLELAIRRRGKLSPMEAVRIAKEVAEGLSAAHAKGLIHRDLKPANIWQEKETGRTKILDFGLVRFTETASQITDSGQVLGTPNFMSPEQALGDEVDARTDLWSLGCVLFMSLTGSPPFDGSNVATIIQKIVDEPPPPTLEQLTNVPATVVRLVSRLLAKKPADRPQSAANVAAELAEIYANLSASVLQTKSPAEVLEEHLNLSPSKSVGELPVSSSDSRFGGLPLAGEVLIVDDSTANREVLVQIVRSKGYDVRAVGDGKLALHEIEKKAPDLILLDISMPELDGYEVCQKLKQSRATRDIPVIFISGLVETIDKVRAFAAGGVDYIPKPFQFEEVEARIDAHLRLRFMQRQLEQHNRSLEEKVQEQIKEISDLQMSTIFALAKLAEFRDTETGKHVERVQVFCKMLAQRMRTMPRYAASVSENYVTNIFHASPLHDIGKVAIPDAILLKPGKLEPHEFEIIKTHTQLGARTLEDVRHRYPKNAFINMGIAIARSHHEKWDGTGYPDGLAEEDIPLSARIMAVADVYDALRSKRPYKSPMSHEDACQIIRQGSGSHFDPGIVDVFCAIQDEFRQMWQSMADA